MTIRVHLDTDIGGDNTPGVKPGFVHAKWRDMPNGVRADENINKQQRAVVSLKGVLAGWDYETAVSYNENKITQNLYGYSDGNIISKGVLDGVINVFGDQSAAGTDKNAALINLHLATGQIGKPGAGPFSLTGQPNAAPYGLAGSAAASTTAS